MIKKSMEFIMCCMLLVTGCLLGAVATGETTYIYEDSTCEKTTNVAASESGAGGIISEPDINSTTTENITTSDSFVASEAASLDSQIDTYKILIAVLVVAVVALIITLVIPKVRKNNGEDSGNSVLQKDRESTNKYAGSKKNQGRLAETVKRKEGKHTGVDYEDVYSNNISGSTVVGYVANAASLAQEIERISEGVNAPIIKTYQGSVISTQKDTHSVGGNVVRREADFDIMHQRIMSIYFGDTTPNTFKESVVALNISNLYKLKISDNAKPIFRVSSDINNARYLLVGKKYLYVNYNVYRNDDFKLYSDIDAVDKCFEIISSKGNNIFNYGAKISELKPAILGTTSDGYELAEKGQITVNE